MTTRNISLLGATYSAVPQVQLPVSGGGTATFTEITDTTATASDVASGKYFYTAAGVKTQGTASGGGGSGMQVATATATPSTASTSIQFTGLQGEPTSFYVVSAADLATGASPYKVAAVVYDGTDHHAQIVTNTSNAQATYDGATVSHTYSNGMLTVTSSSHRFQAVQYKLVYTHGGNSANIGTSDVQVGSGATSIAFAGLTEEPTCWSLIFKSNFGTSSGYQRVMAVADDGNSTYGVAMDSGASAESAWTSSYNNGTLTISSQSTSAGGYFHQPGYYQLTYGIGGEVEPPTIEPLTVTQNGTYQESGKAYSPVTVNVSGGGSWTVKQTTWSNNSTSTVSHQFTGLSGTPKAAVLRCTSQLTRSSSNTYYYIADIIWDGTDAWGNYHLRSNGTFNNVAKDAASGFNVSVGTNSITFSSDATSRSSAPGSFFNGTYELTYWY